MDASHGGAIVSISSTGGTNGLFGLGAYSASKWAVRGPTKTAALEFARDNIRVNSIRPGSVRTPMVVGAVAVGFEEATREDRLFRDRRNRTRSLVSCSSWPPTKPVFFTGSEFIADGGQLPGPVPD